MPSSTSKNFTCFHFSEVSKEERILHFWYYLSVHSCVRLWTSHFLFCDAIWFKSCRFRLQECGGHKYSILQMPVSWVAEWIMAEFYWERMQYSSPILSIKMDYLMYWSEMLWHCKNHSSHCYIISTFRIMPLILVYWSQNLWNVLPAVLYPVFKWNS